MASMKKTGYTIQWPIHPRGHPSGTESVILEIVSRDTLAPDTSAKCAEISPVVSPRDNTIWSIAGSTGSCPAVDCHVVDRVSHGLTPLGFQTSQFLHSELSSRENPNRLADLWFRADRAGGSPGANEPRSRRRSARQQTPSRWSTR